MSIFNKLTTGGVHLHVQAPEAVPSNQVIPVTVTITADNQETISSVEVDIQAQAKEQGMMMGGGQGMGVQASSTMKQTVAKAENREAFTISSGETKTINFQLYLNGNPGQNPLANPGGGLGGALQTLVAVEQKFDHVSYMYSVRASADVQGKSFDASDSQSIQILPATATTADPQPTPIAGDSMPTGSQPATPSPEEPSS